MDFIRGLLDKLKRRVSLYRSGEKTVSLTACEVGGVLIVVFTLLIVVNPAEPMAAFMCIVSGLVGGLMAGYLLATILSFFFKLGK